MGSWLNSEVLLRNRRSNIFHLERKVEESARINMKGRGVEESYYRFQKNEERKKGANFCNCA